MTGVRLTRRGKNLLAILVLITVTYLWVTASNIPDICLTKSGYASCEALNP